MSKDRLLNPLEVSRCIKPGMDEEEQITAILEAQDEKTARIIEEERDVL